MVGILKRIFIIFLFSFSFILEVGEDNVFLENNKNFLQDDNVLDNSGIVQEGSSVSEFE